MRFLLSLLIWFCPTLAHAVDLPAAVQKRLDRNPDAFVADALRLVAGFGGPSGLTGADIDRAIAVDRAAARAGALRDLLVADFDGDGGLSAVEVSGYLSILSARGRGDFLTTVSDADQGQDGALDPAEVGAAAARAAEAAVSVQEVAAMQALLLFDGDGDGGVTAAELRRGVAQAASAAGG
ncbi:hypothetical protein GCM10011452_26390 [Gemmobacter lanyuensis]|uniref:EF-hand domain-containing protein n=1 Tax=Gemmobacter lanyuensis TaxID=1054497 RepID=A0A918IWV6_9RHOB|nr:hypothetical protein [Gemmobacter lanyuensis]GGW36603.1 hypothetical protein GCM10011452_26390 [Gemmobacter lanyuensis]